MDEQPTGEGLAYAMFKKNDKTAAAASLQQEQQRVAGIAPMWNTHFTVYNVDDRIKEAERAGAPSSRPLSTHSRQGE